MPDSTKVLITEETLTNIADAIRAKMGVTNTFLPSEMPRMIRAILTIENLSNGVSIIALAAPVTDETPAVRVNGYWFDRRET